ncbi:DUF1684 domain-containing protein [Halomarina halobia]|uniref:DUF1684 domain-containing protein n=1 Tax=Halomarina halobia TaxID=3033386 RepID=A0ABD6AAW2_9EURY|nr:DUF1684 domain-containing protein [Halomarina sp. PSR21]
MTDDFDTGRWRGELLALRDEKDEFFAEHPQSPIPPDERGDFDGLAYFEPDPAYRVEARVERHDDPDPVVMETTAGPEVRYERVATLRFEVRGTEQTLGAYRQDSEEGLFVPFRDKTTGQESYHQGRYMEIDVEGDLPRRLPLDFNLAYNPFCAYSETFSCPLPPEENWQDVTVEAGERAY